MFKRVKRITDWKPVFLSSEEFRLTLRHCFYKTGKQLFHLITNLEGSMLCGYQQEAFQKTESAYQEVSNPPTSGLADTLLLRNLPANKVYSF